MLSCFIDESTAHGETDPSTTVAGYVATGKQWHTFNLAWSLMTTHYGIDGLGSLYLSVVLNWGGLQIHWRLTARSGAMGEILQNVSTPCLSWW
jgi:hypothetical protein